MGAMLRFRVGLIDLVIVLGGRGGILTCLETSRKPTTLKSGLTFFRFLPLHTPLLFGFAMVSKLRGGHGVLVI